jgi:hypothetical protein
MTVILLPHFLLCQIAPDQVLPIIDEVEGPQLFEQRGRSFSAIKPAQELAQVVVVAAHRGGREIVALQLAQKIGEPAVG